MECTADGAKTNECGSAFERGEEIAAAGTFAQAFCYTPASAAINSLVFPLSPPPPPPAGQAAADFIVFNDSSHPSRSPASSLHTIYVTKTNAPKLPEMLDTKDASIWLASTPCLAMKSSLELRPLYDNPSSFRHPLRMERYQKDDQKTTFVTMSG